MALTEAQVAKIARNRKTNPPSFYNAATDQSEVISAYTEGALILIGSSVKQKAAQYLDILLDNNPSKSDYDKITARAASKQLANTEMILSELSPVVDKFSDFRDDLVGGLDLMYAEGMQPLLAVITQGVSAITNKLTKAGMSRKINKLAEKKYASGSTDSQRKEWRSWKRVLLAYP